MEKRLHRTNMWKQKQNKQKLGFLGNGIIHARTGWHAQLDHAYADPYLEILINTETKQKPNKIAKRKSSNLKC